MTEHDEAQDRRESLAEDIAAADWKAESVAEQEERDRPTIRMQHRTLRLVLVAAILAMLLAAGSMVVIWIGRDASDARAARAELDADAARAEAAAARREAAEARKEQQCRAEFNAAVQEARAEVDYATAARDTAQDALVGALGGVAKAGEPPLDVGQAFANLEAASGLVTASLDGYREAIEDYSTAVAGECNTDETNG